MFQIRPGDLISVRAEGRYFFALILDRARLFGGNWVFAFHKSATAPLTPEELLRGRPQGFNAFVDFLGAKREGRAERLARDVEPRPFQGPGFLKGTNTLKGKASLWFIYTMAFQEVRRTTRLSRAERKYPEFSCINDVLMIERINQKWLPEKDPRL